MSSSAFNLKMYPVTKKVEELLAKELFFTELNTTATCLICRQKVLYRVFNMKRHYTVKHAEQYNKYKEEERKVVSDRLHADFNYNRSTGEPELKEESKPGQITTGTSLFIVF
ncbi:General transcription factor II-I repeat domain-containing protein 2 [Collichthys lucidus]|uniref:General transcription factor II-I repeat domain-containing protein 2 n=1 Tax=Collichthys lucidus TaxID=240159 RepID=A0A4U5UDS5_COLLU|nr:General transcription factor II-I repeat domain-containing protein 2 [Collichthys lucidus]